MYSNYLSINKNFQSSINLELDLNNIQKINEYIPTHDICDVIKFYIKSALGLTKDRSTTLVGPYGKGKSFILLVISFLLGKNKNTSEWENLVAKIKEIDTELYDLLMTAKENDTSLLFVIINSNYENIVQSFQISLNDTLKRENLSSIIPNSTYQICIDLLDKWEKSDNLNYDIAKKCLEVNKIDVADLKMQLSQFSPTAYDKFKKLYNCINIGLEFNPLISNDIVKIYSDTTYQVTKHGYNGIFVVFDEFSKFIENTSDNLTKDLKIVQDFAELASRSPFDKQIHFCCIAHKSMALYKNSNKKNDQALDNFKTVEGRFKEIRFNRTSEENYYIISSAIIKDSKFSKIRENKILSLSKFYEKIDNIGLCSDAKAKKILYEGCFPLNPLTTYSLIQISEFVAQNERTLFTFLADTNENSYETFLRTHDDGLFNVYKIYDYFSKSLQSDDDERVKNIWYRTEAILRKVGQVNERKIIKSLSIILLINDFEKLSPNEEMLSLATGLPLKEANIAIKNLIDGHFLRKNVLNNLLSFALSGSKEIDEHIELLKKTKLKKVKFSDIANDINQTKYVLPHRYNELNKIKRFYKVLFIDENDLLKLKSFAYIFENNYCDGLVLYVLGKEYNEESIKATIEKINDDRVIVKYPNESLDEGFFESLLRYACLSEMYRQQGLDDTTLMQIKLLKKELEDDCRKFIRDNFVNNCKFYCSHNVEGFTFNELLNDAISSVYNFKLIFNNELVNKRNVTKQYQKAINNVIDYVLDNESGFNYSETSPEQSIKDAILDYNDSNLKRDIESSKNFREVIDYIKRQITLSEGKKVSVSDILGKYLKKPYSIRLGVMPIILAKAISELSDNIVLYYNNKEIDLDSKNLVKAVDNGHYAISFSKGSAEQKQYLNDLMEMFKVKTAYNFRKDYNNLAVQIQKTFLGMPQVVRLATLNDNFLGLDTHFLNLKNSFLDYDLNAYESVFDKPKEIFETNNFHSLFQELAKSLDDIKGMLHPFKNQLIKGIKAMFDIKQEASLTTGLKDFNHKYVEKGKKPFLEDQYKHLYESIENDLSYSDFEALDKISQILVGTYIEDWNTNKIDDLDTALLTYKNYLVNCKEHCYSDTNKINLDVNNVELSSNGMLLKNNLESVLEEFSGGVSSTDKINALLALLKDLL